MKTKRTFQLIAGASAFLTLLPLSGCKSTEYERHYPDQSWEKFSDNRLFMKSDFAGSLLRDTNGVVRVDLNVKSRADAEGLKAASEGVQNNLKPTP